MSEEVRLFLDPYAMFPEAARRVEILEDIKRKWPQIAGPDIARYSRPYDLGVNGLWVQVDRNKPLAKTKLANSRKSIERRLAKKCGYESDGEFCLTLTDEIPAPRRIARRETENPAAKIVVTEEEIRQCMEAYLETLPEDINYELSRLEVLLRKLGKLRS